ncbi:hypothetical protein [Methanosarcina acetivorans]|uniref:Uncharacterized protein n=1 Tax=Methanosarcina acetivorans (strain ATCC 35395 / DSM 2834 / JCM 12185 / C2A) TaxID=188937 RepID=Q8TPL2_METAC|nr:hypothetical protein [Methanosarcina acetivorans]AAM05302.1 predicted protein [Methanosarcina acetivorans C2A]
MKENELKNVELENSSEIETSEPEVTPTESTTDDENYVIVYKKGMKGNEKLRILDDFLATDLTDSVRKYLNRDDIELTGEITSDPQALRDYLMSRGVVDKKFIQTRELIEQERTILNYKLLVWEKGGQCARLKTDEDIKLKKPTPEERNPIPVCDLTNPEKSIEDLTTYINKEYGINIKLNKEFANDSNAFMKYLDSTCPGLSGEKKEQLVRTVFSARKIFRNTEYDIYKIETFYYFLVFRFPSISCKTIKF